MMKLAPVFQPWIWCLTWVFILVGCTALLVKQFYQTAITPDCKIEYGLLSNQPPSSLNSPLVIALGDSLLKHATPKTQWLGNDVRWFRANIADARQKQFFPLLVAIEKVKPRILLVQDSLLLERSEPRWDIRAKATLRYFAALVIPLRTTPCNKAMDTWRPTVKGGQYLLDIKEVFREEYANSMVLSKSSRQWLIQLQNLADKVVIVHFPRSLAQSTGTRRVEWLENLQTELANLHIDVVTVGDPQDNNYYRDGAHVNRQGRELRMQQLALLIESQL